jgi:hypothetical protein
MTEKSTSMSSYRKRGTKNIDGGELKCENITNNIGLSYADATDRRNWRLVLEVES